MSEINRNKDEIITLLDGGTSQAEIIRLFAAKGISIPKSSLSDFARQRQDDNATIATMEDDGLADRFAAALDFQRSVADQLIDDFIDVRGSLQQLEHGEEERHTALLEAIGTVETNLATLPAPSPADDLKPMFEDAINRLDKLATRTGGAALRYIWAKALLYTGIAWGLVITAWYVVATPLVSVMWLTLLAD